MLQPLFSPTGLGWVPCADSTSPPFPANMCVCVRGLRVIHELLLGALSSWWQLCSSSGAWIFSPIPSLLLFVNELWPNLSQEMPLQSSQPVFGRLTPAEEIPRDPSEPSIQTKSSRLCLLTPSDGDTPNLPSRAVLCSRAQFSQGRSRGAGFCTSSHVAGTGKGSTGLASQTRVTWQQFVPWVPEHFHSTSGCAPACISLFWQAGTRHSHL